MMMLRGLVACTLVLLTTASCKRDTAAKANTTPDEERAALDRDVTAWAQLFSAVADWKIGPFTVQVEDALRGKRLLLKGVAVDDVIRGDDGYRALIGSDETDAILEDSNVPTNLRFFVACSEADANALLAKAGDIASMSNNDDTLPGRVSIVDAVVEVSAVRRISGFDVEAEPDGDSAHIETLQRNRFLATGKLISFRLRPHPFWGQTTEKR